jgi:hypothetical protein
MHPQIELRPSQRRDLARIRELGRALLERVADQLANLQPLSLDPDAIREEITATLDGKDFDAAESLWRQLMSLNGMIRQLDLSVDDMWSALEQAVADGNVWSKAEIDQFRDLKDVLCRLVGLPQIRLLSKALELSYDFANLLQRSNILTDIRPVFDDAATEIDGCVVTFTLRLRYDNPSGAQSLSIAMDQSDVKSLLAQCERALAKAEVARDRTSTLGIPARVWGSNDHASD